MGKLSRNIQLVAVGVMLTVGCGEHRFQGTPVESSVAPEIIGTSHKNQFSTATLKGKVSLFTFGYTSCPDVCPTTLTKARAVMKDLGEAAPEAAVVFVSVDPDRDTSERLDGYVAAFDERFIGVHVPADKIQRTMSDYHVTASRRLPQSSRFAPGEDMSAYYTIDHSAGFIVVDKQGTFRVRFPLDTPAEKIAEDVKFLINEKKI